MNKINHDVLNSVLTDNEFYDFMKECSSLCAETSLRPILEYASKELGCGKVSVVLRDNNICYTTAGFGIDDNYVGIVNYGKSVSRQVMKIGYPVILDMKKTEFPKNNAESDYKTDLYMGVPILSGKESSVIGVLNITDIEGEIGDEFQERACLFSHFAGDVLENVKTANEKCTRLVNLIDIRDNYTGGHSRRVPRYAHVIAEKMGLPRNKILLIDTYGLFHDIGKVGVRDVVLNKPGQLSDDEFEQIKKHTVMGLDVIGDCPGSEIISQHHERWDGGGYHGIKGLEIDIGARITACADTFDAMVTDRPYRDGMPVEKAIEIIGECSGSQIEPSVADAFLKICRDHPDTITKIMSMRN